MGNKNSTKIQHEQPPSPPSPSEISNFTCEICIEPMLPNNRFRNNNSLCIHPFCIDCVTKYLQLKIEDDRIAEIKCPGVNCQNLLDPETFEKWCDLLCERELLRLDLCYCPNRQCSAVVVNECGGVVKRSVCPNCKRLFCFSCKLPWHPGFRCEESGEPRDRNDVVFGVLAEANRWKRCPRCHHCVELVHGCNIVKCRCGSSFCYNCGGAVLGRGCVCNNGARMANRHFWVSTCCSFLIVALCVLLLFVLPLRFGWR